MHTQSSQVIQKYFDELENELRNLATKHNYLVESISLLWSEVQRTSTDPLTTQLCQRRIEELNVLIHEDHHTLKNPIPTSDQTSWD